MSGIWTEHRNAEGRTYWFNTSTRESVWEKPDALKTPFEKALGQTPWKEYVSGGRKYYYNAETKESKWDMPDELLLLLEKVEKEKPPAPPAAAPNPRMIAPNFTSGQITSVAEPSLGGVGGPPNPNTLAVGPHTGALPFSGPLPTRPSIPNLPDDPVIPHNGFATVEEGEKAFTHLLRKAGVDANWTWDQTMRAIITDPLYKALNTLAEKKNAWQKFVEGLKEKEREEREARLAKNRPAIRNMLKGNPNVFHYSTFPTADKLFSQHPIWQQAKIESERRLIFEEYVAELKQREIQESREIRSRSVSKVVSLFKKLNVDALTRWRQAHTMLLESDDWNEDDELRKLPSLDILLAFEDYSRVRDREFDEQMRREQVEKTRRERKAREGFKELLRELVEASQIKARCKWKDIYPTFQSDERYLNLLGNPGSNPLELFWDVVDQLDQNLDAQITLVEDGIKQYNKESDKTFTFGHDTTVEEFRAVMAIASKDHEALQNMPDSDLQEVYEFLRSEASKKLEADKKRAERKQRHLQDDLRYALKKLPESIYVEMTYEQAVPLMEHLPEYKALEDEGRRAAFSKFIKRQMERIRERELSDDGGSGTERKRKEPAGREKDADRERDRDYHRDRDRDHREKGYDSREQGGRGPKHHRRGHDTEHDTRRDRDRDYRDRERDRDRDRDSGYKPRYSREYDRERERERDRGGRDRQERNREDSRREEGRREERRAPPSAPKDWEDPRHTVVHEGGEKLPEREKRERENSDGDRSEKRARYGSEEPGRDSRAREETPEEGEI